MCTSSMITSNYNITQPMPLAAYWHETEHSPGQMEMLAAQCDNCSTQSTLRLLYCSRSRSGNLSSVYVLGMLFFDS